MCSESSYRGDDACDCIENNLHIVYVNILSCIYVYMYMFEKELRGL